MRGVLVAARRLPGSVARARISCLGSAARLCCSSCRELLGGWAAWLSRGVRVADDVAVRGDQPRTWGGRRGAGVPRSGAGAGGPGWAGAAAGRAEAAGGAGV